MDGYTPSQEDITETINVSMTEADIRHKADYENYRNFLGTIMVVFDMNPEMLWHLYNLDYLCPPTKARKRLNYIQWLTEPTNERVPVEETLSYIFRNTDPHWGESYQRTEYEKELRAEHLEKIKTEYGGRNKYLETISERLWMEPNYLDHWKI
jgi:hypothetical protein